MLDVSRSVLALCGGACLGAFLSACTLKATFNETTDTTSNITGTTSGRAWWNEDGLLKPEHKIAAFTAYNAENLEADLAHGQGEYLTSLETLLDAPNPGRFSTHAQASFSQWRASGATSPDALVSRFRDTTAAR
mgnify:FL=1